MRDEVITGAIRSSRYIANLRERWNGQDSEENFDKHLQDPKKSFLLTLNKFTRDNVEYRYNNLGFRSDDTFDLVSPAEGTMYLGCSFTKGNGLNVEDTWAYKLNQRIGGGCFYNMGQGGTGIETAYRMLCAYADVLKIKRVYYLYCQSGERREFYHCGSGFVTQGPWAYEESFVAHHMTHPIELHMVDARTTDAMRGFARDRGIEIYKLNTRTELATREKALKIDSWARDLSHSGSEYHDLLISDMSQWQLL